MSAFGRASRLASYHFSSTFARCQDNISTISRFFLLFVIYAYIIASLSLLCAVERNGGKLKYSEALAALRKEKGLTQSEVAEYISRHSDKPYTFKAISHWENGVNSPSVEQFLLMCELYEVSDIQYAFRGIKPEYRNLSKLNALGISRVEEYISMLSRNSIFSESENNPYRAQRRVIKLYDASAAAGFGNFLDSDSYEDFEVDETVPDEAGFAIRVSGDSMSPRFVDGQIAFVKEQQWLDVGDIGIFALNGDSFIKKLGQGELISLNTMHKPIKIKESDSLYVFGKVVG